jgi:hypothetical protein
MRRTWLSSRAVAVLLLAALSGCASKKNSASGSSTGASSAAPTSSSASSSAAPSSTASSPTPSPSGAGQVISTVVTYNWSWPNTAWRPCVVKHHYPVPPLPVLTAISVGEHYQTKPTYDRISFTFTGTFPSYDAQWVDRVVADGSGKVVSLAGNDFLRIRFNQATAHDSSGTSSVQSAPPRHVGYKAINEYAQAGDFEGVLSYGISDYRTITQSNPQTGVRVIEVKKSDGYGGYRYVVAFDIQNRGIGGNPV